MDGEARIIRHIAERAKREHWPKPYVPALVWQGGTMVLVNACLLWLALQDLLSPLSVVTFCLGELLLLALFARAELIPVSLAARFDGQPHALLGAGEKSSFLGRLFICVFMSIWLSAAYAFGVLADPNRLLVVSGAHPLEMLERLHVLWPLLLSAVVALIAMVGNWMIWQHRGGTFVPEMSQPTTPKTLTVFVAPIPATMGLFTFIDEDGNTALFAWCMTFLAIKCLLEFGMLGLQLFGLYILDSLPSPAPAAATAGE